MDLDQTKWYEENLRPHEGLLRAWLNARFVSGNEVEDILQEALMRVLNARLSKEIKAPKAFLFTTARNLALMRLRRENVRNEISLTDFEDMDILEDGGNTREMVVQTEELEILRKAIQSLPARCREIVLLRKVHGMSTKQIAKQLDISVHTVATQGTIGIKKITKFFEQYQGNKGYFKKAK